MHDPHSTNRPLLNVQYNSDSPPSLNNWDQSLTSNVLTFPDNLIPLLGIFFLFPFKLIYPLIVLLKRNSPSIEL